jgi:hypothetical protein
VRPSFGAGQLPPPLMVVPRQVQVGSSVTSVPQKSPGTSAVQWPGTSPTTSP